MDEKDEKRIKRASRFVEESLTIRQQPADEVGSVAYVARVLAMATLPHSKQEKNEFKRTNGDLTISMVAPSEVGLPFGTYPRLILSWIVTEATRTQSHVLELGDSLSAFMHELGMVPHGGRWGTITRLREQMSRLVATAISWKTERPGERHLYSVVPIYGSHLYWNPRNPFQRDLWQSTLEINRDFYDAVIQNPVPVDMRAMKVLAHERSPLALDIYSWLTYRLSYLEEPTVIPWGSLQFQFGGDFARKEDFKRKFLERLQLVKQLYPAARVRPSEDRRRPGLILEPSPTHVPKLVKPKLKRLPEPPSPE